VIRRARPNEADRLREIAVAAKAHWGYELDQVRDWADQGDFSAEGMRSKEFYVAEEDGRVVAFASLIPQAEVGVLDDLWVEPEAMGAGLGTRLFRFAAERATELGAQRLEWEAEPHAVGFYERMGGRYLRDSEPSEWGRVLPVMGVDLPEPS
jgi:N-acetylglutamate synthase-like GNAT family acetyltransferase